jgi:hypothetical protein
MRRARSRLIAAVLCGIASIFPALSAKAQSVCVAVESGHGARSHPVGVGDTLRISFSHSIYGSQVEEHFRIGPKAFHGLRLRYSEPRLVEFYGHDSSRFEAGWWVVENSGGEFPQLNLQVSPQSSIRISFGNRRIILNDGSAAEGRLRLSVTGCDGKQNG